MKRLNIFLSAVLCCLTAFAQDFSLSIANAEAFLTEEFYLQISLSNKSEISSMQCDVILPEGIVANGSPTLSNRATGTHTIRYNVNRDGRLRIVIHSSKNENIIGEEGLLFNLPLTSTSDCQIGDNTISFDKVIMSSSNGIEYSALPTTSSVSIKDLPIQLDKQKLTMPLGSAEKLNLTFLPEYPYDKSVVWSSSEKKVAKVSEDGTVTTIGLGSSIITARVANGMHIECEVTVVEVKAERIELGKTILQLIPERNETLTATVYPENTTNKTITWTSSDENVAKVSTQGYVQALSLGKAIITATCGEISEQCEVSVQELVVNTTEITMPIGGVSGIRIEMSPMNFGEVTWISSDEDVVTVESNGSVACRVYAVGIGQAYVTGANEKYSVTCKVTVTPNYVNKIIIDNITTIKHGATTTCGAWPFPQDAVDRSLTWSSSDPSVLSIEEVTGPLADGSSRAKIKGVSPGVATITVTAVEGGYSEDLTITVEPVAVQSITLNQTKVDIDLGAEKQIVAKVSPENSSDKSIIWTSSDTTVATVSESGIVKAVALGHATITATAVGGASATCEVTVNPVKSQSISLNKTSLALQVGDEEALVATVLPENTTDKTIEWSSSNEKVATVSSEGVVKAIGVGEATIIAKNGSRTASCSVKVNPILVESVMLNETEKTLLVGESTTLTASVLPENATNKTLSWTSSDIKVATVSSAGEVKAVGLGTATITATAEGGAKAECIITVLPVLSESITLSKTETELFVGGEEKLVATILPENATDKTVTWSSSDEAVATVSADGIVKAVGVGSATITAKNGELAATCVVIVNPVLANKITLSASELSLILGQSADLTATVSPDNTTDKTITWTSSDESVATVSADGKVSALGLGTATITATAVGGAKAECAVTVNPVASDGVVLNKTSLTLKIGEEESLIATVLPENTTDKTVAWSSSDTSVATVDESGRVKAVAVGTATITAKNGANTATCEVTVNPILAETVTLNKTTLTLLLGQSADLTATVSPDNTTDKTVTWTSSDEIVATVTADGKVSAVGLGTATVTATAVGGAKAECTVTVNPVASDGVVLNKTSMTLKIGEEESLIATVLPESTTDKTVSWSSSDTSVATVDENGRVNAVAVGTATITAKNGANTATCEVTVNPILAETVTLNKTTLTLLLGQSADLTVTVSPDNTTDKTVTWTSSDESVATVTADGKVSAVGLGTATVTATAVGGAKAECAVTVNPVASDGVVLNKTSLTLKIGEEESLIATVLPENTTDKTVAWSSSDTSVATVDESGRVKAVAVGTATVTAKNGANTASCEVTVKPVLAETVALNKTTLTLLLGQSADLTATVSPDNTTDKTVTWTSSDESVATVTADGKVSAVGLGTATVTATAVGGAKAECAVTVNPDSYTITYFVDGEVYYTETVKIGAVITPIAEPEKEGHTFSGWSEMPVTMPAHDITVTGTFTVNKYMVRYYDGEALLAEYEVEFGAEIPQYEYNNDEFIFQGWDGEVYETMPAHDIAYYAITTPNGIADIKIDDNAEITVYDMTGLTVYKGKKAGASKQLKGMYIVKYDDKTVKCRL